MSKRVTIVHLSGITHVLLYSPFFEFDKNTCFDFAKNAIKKLGLENKEAVGCIFVSKEKENISIDPVVWVRGTNSMYYETACGSGTAAVGFYFSKKARKNFKRNILQPSGKSIRVEVKIDSNSNIKSLAIGGVVDIIAKGVLYI